MGSFDTVRYVCPHCRKHAEVQTKAGDCRQMTYPDRRVPVEIAASLRHWSEVKSSCCGKPVKFATPYMPETTQVVAVIPHEESDDGS